jgi:hypothetical protein
MMMMMMMMMFVDGWMDVCCMYVVVTIGNKLFVIFE